MMDTKKIRHALEETHRIKFINELDTFTVIQHLPLRRHIRDKIQCLLTNDGPQPANAHLIDEVARNPKLLKEFIHVLCVIEREDLANLIDVNGCHPSQMKSSSPVFEPVEQATGCGIEEVGASAAAVTDHSPNGNTVIDDVLPSFGCNEDRELPNLKIFPPKQDGIFVSPERLQCAAPSQEQSPEENSAYYSSLRCPTAQENCDGDMKDDDSSLYFNDKEVDKAYNLDGDTGCSSEVAGGISEIKSLNYFDQSEEDTVDSMEENRNDMSDENVSEVCESPGVNDCNAVAEGGKVYKNCTFNITNRYEKSNVQFQTEGSKITSEKAKKNSRKSTQSMIPYRPHDSESIDTPDLDRVNLKELNESKETSLVDLSDDDQETRLKAVVEPCQSDVKCEAKSDLVLYKLDEDSCQESDQSQTSVKQIEPSQSNVTDSNSESSLSTPDEEVNQNGGIVNTLKLHARQAIWTWYNGIG